MRHRTSLPRRLGSVFHIADAAAAGVGRGRADAADLHRPFRGVRAFDVPDTFLAKAESYKPRMREGHRFCEVTAARIWGLPLPWFWTSAEPLHIAVPADSSPPRGRGVRGCRVASDRGTTFIIGGLPAVDPVTTVSLLAPRLDVPAIVVILDALVTPSRRYRGLRVTRPFASVDSIRAQLDALGAFPGVRKVREALMLVRTGVDSPKETLTRLLIGSAGLPEPVLQHEVHDARGHVATVDMAYPGLKIAIEYEGDGHRTSQKQWRIDIQRQRRLEALGWIVIRVTELDLASGHAEFVAILTRTIRTRQQSRR